MKAALIALLSVPLNGSALVAERSPSLTLVDRRFVAVGLPADVLRSPEVRKHLMTGLTTSFVVRASASRAEVLTRGGGRIDIRYEPWDETFLATLFHVDATSHQEKRSSFDHLVEWWQKAQLKILPIPSFLDVAQADLSVEVVVLPFSAPEQNDAQKWFARSLEASRPNSSAAVPGGSRDQGQQSSNILETLIATSIKRRALLRFRWNVRLVPGSVR